MIAIVDDDEPTSHSIQRLLRAYGFESHTYDSASAFLAAECLNDLHCLILDVRMPGMTGIQLQHHLLTANIQIPVIYMTGNVTKAVEEVTRQTGTVAVLEKPFNPDVLISHIKTTVKVAP